MDDPNLLRAGRAAHLKIILISLAATIVVVLVGLNARMNPADMAGSTAVIKAQPASAFAGNELANDDFCACLPQARWHLMDTQPNSSAAYVSRGIARYEPYVGPVA